MSVHSSAAGAPAEQEVKTLVCKRDMDNALLCYESLFAAVGPKLKLVIHEDGTLDAFDFDALQQRFPSATLVRRAERESEVLEALARYPHCRAHRSQHPLSNKLLDIPLLSREPLRYVDSDILFFRKVNALFPEGDFPLAMLDDDQGYSARLIDITRKHKIPIPSGFNSGLLRLDLADYDLDRIEWFLGKPELLRIPAMAEQTCYAMLTAEKGLRQFSPAQFFCKKYRPLEITTRTVAAHFIYHLKGLIRKYHPTAMESLRESPVTELQLQSPRPLTLLTIVKRRLLRRFVHLGYEPPG
ncbi:MAG: hypothetical protein P4L99_07635 [Chthoniobacter sp.]|nr:hypothetical protein [Chthoniobacter sp.]